MTQQAKNVLVCPSCRVGLDAEFACGACAESYPRIASIRVLLPAPRAQIERWRKQLGLVIRQGLQTRGAIEVQATEPSVGTTTQTRLYGLARAILEQVEDIAVVLGPVLGGPLPPDENLGFPRGAMDYMTYLHRDWAWAEGRDAENERALDAIRRVTHGRQLGRTLVLGAGACRLAYDLHLQCGGSQTAVVDIDPFLLVIAEAVVRGAQVPLTETSVNAPEVDPVGRRWTLSAPSGPLTEDVFQFYLANGTEPPFAAASFDTIVTPWFIDQVPTDLAGLLRTVNDLLVPGGRWINQGPLIY
ncbi:MAG TPA: methyltransferase domain-containing protein, partial [Polyangiaceae bacterium]